MTAVIMQLVPTSVIRLQGATALFAVLLFWATWPLWSGEGSLAVQIPWLAIFRSVPRWVDWIAILGTGMGTAGLISGFSSVKWNRIATAFFTCSLLILVSLDQHRFQPWVCQFLLLGGLMWIVPDERGLRYWKIVVASIYLWSAVSKMDAAFLTSHGELLLKGLLAALHIDQTYWSKEAKAILVGLFPAGEFLVGLLLLNRRTVRFGLPASIIMHLALLWTLGVGLKHEPSVLLWNGYFLVQNILLFEGAGKEFRVSSLPGETRSRSLQTRWAILYTVVASLYPLLESFGYCDHWPAWAVYSSRPAQVKIRVDEEAAANLPEDIQKLLGVPEPFDDRIPLQLDAWSFQLARCPVYPQTRYRLAVGLALLSAHVPNEALSAEIALTPNRFTGERERVHLRGTEGIRQYCRQFWGNTLPRVP